MALRAPVSRTSADIIVLGGGIIGGALAEELARAGRRVVLIERGRMGQEASTAAAGILSAAMDVPQPGPLFELCQLARRIYPQWIAHLEARSRLSLGFHVDGIVYLAMTAAQERAKADQVSWQRRRGLPIESWSPRRLRREEPAVDGPVRKAFFFANEAQVENVKLMEALAAACRAARVQVLEQTIARRLLVAHKAVRGVQTNHGRILAPVLINCLGSWAPWGGRSAVPLPVEPARGQMLAFRGPRRLFRHPVMAERGYVVQRRDGRLLVGSTVERVGYDKALTFEGLHAILTGVRHFTGALSQCTFLEAWTGLRPYSPDGLPILGRTALEGLYAATGHFRHGILLAPATARLMTELILHGRASVDLAPFSPSRFHQKGARH